MGHAWRGSTPPDNYKENYVNKIQRFLAALVLLCTGLVGVLSVTAPADAKDTSWGRAAASQTVDVTSEKDTSWGKQARSPVCDTASWFCGSITHYSTDYGVDGPFLVRCRFGDSTSNRWVYEGQKSTSV